MAHTLIKKYLINGSNYFNNCYKNKVDTLFSIHISPCVVFVRLKKYMWFLL